MRLDKNKDGYLALEELHEGILGTQNPEEIKRILKSVDTDHNGMINYTGREIH